MGLAASQARWISLTARKSNVEYEGQQINQARTALANKSSELWNQLYMMAVPVPPSTQDFCKVQYEFNAGDQAETIKEIQPANYHDPIDNITYNSFVTYFSPMEEYKGIRLTNSNPQVQHVYTQKDDNNNIIEDQGGNNYLIGGQKYNNLGKFPDIESQDPNSEWQTLSAKLDAIVNNSPNSKLASEWLNAKSTHDYSNIFYYTDTTGETHFTSASTGDYYLVGTKKYINLADFSDIESQDPKSQWQIFVAELDTIAKDWPDTTLAAEWNKAKETHNYGNIYYYTDTAGEMHFALGNTKTKQNDTLDDCIADKKAALHTYYSDYQKVNKEVSKYAIVEFDASDRATSIQLQGSSAVYEISANTTTDNAAYDDAMNKYNYDKQVYEKNVQDINARTEQIQTEDRTLELRLRALDTEQNALQTEMDAVHKIISKNIESTFKTFES